ncbi:MAG: MerR family transcriptional regulator [Daejeonella sp.]
MKIFSISDIEILTGIKAHTIRVWEQRYDFFTSRRTESNIRYYDEEDLRLFLNIAALNENGYKISAISKMTTQQITQMVTKLRKDHFNPNLQVQLFANAILTMNNVEMENLLSLSIKERGIENTIEEIVLPLLDKIGFMWQTGTINTTHEHFATHHISNRITIATHNLKTAGSAKGKNYLLFLPEGEFHEIGLLYAKYLLKLNGHHAVYLGANTPIADLAEAVSIYKPDYALTVITQVRANCDVNEIINKTLKNIKITPLIFLSLPVLKQNITANRDLIFMDNFAEFKKLIGFKLIFPSS